MKMKKTFLSLALSGAMVLGMMPGMTMTALADDTTSYTLTIPSSLTVENSGWNATSGISATGTLESGKTLTVTASSDGEFALVNQSDNNKKVGYKLATEENGAETTSWTFNSLSSTATTKAMGIIVDNYDNAAPGTYTDTVTFTASIVGPVKVTDVTLNKNETSIKVGNTETLTASVSPDDATDKTVTWSSDNENVATVNASTGVVTAKSAGTANITATANDGSGKTATCKVTVLTIILEEKLTSSAIVTVNVKSESDDVYIVRGTYNGSGFDYLDHSGPSGYDAIFNSVTFTKNGNILVVEIKTGLGDVKFTFNTTNNTYTQVYTQVGTTTNRGPKILSSIQVQGTNIPVTAE